MRNSGTLGGNVANGSPIGDSMPLLIALNAQVVLASVRGERRLALESLYTGYRQNVMAPDELLVRIDAPLHTTQPTAATGRDFHLLRAYKVSKRQDDDISAVCLVLRVAVQAGIVTEASIGVGGVAATPVRATQAEDALQHVVVDWEELPQLLASLVTRFWNESQGHSATTLEQIAVEVLP